MSQPAKRQVESILTAASQLGSGESMADLVNTLSPEERERVKASAKKIGTLSRGVTKRAQAGIEAIPEDEWERLVREANEADE